MAKNVIPIKNLGCKRWIGLSILLVISGCTKTIDHSTEGDSVSTKYVVSHAPSAATIERAKAFRAEMDSLYKTMKEQNKYNSDFYPEIKTQIYQIAQKYIPIGSSMVEAGNFLTAAGFQLSDFPRNNPYPRFFIGKFTMEQFLLGQNELFIVLSPISDENFTIKTMLVNINSTGL
ncbi:hypothetical protein [Aquirhabdus sp.]|uniref:hypothetical protein n=1 Tax=Aquirhabdus sp. TaxID=2824160 RepID=UPI00396C4A03